MSKKAILILLAAMSFASTATADAKAARVVFGSMRKVVAQNYKLETYLKNAVKRGEQCEGIGRGMYVCRDGETSPTIAKVEGGRVVSWGFVQRNERTCDKVAADMIRAFDPPHVVEEGGLASIWYRGAYVYAHQYNADGDGCIFNVIRKSSYR